MRRSTLTAALLLLALSGCGGEDDVGEPVDLRHAKAMATSDSLAVWPGADAGRPVVLYVDRSQSMRGFLDPAYPGRVATDYRSVIDGFDARLKPSQVYGFGNEVAAAGQGLGVLGNKDFYGDANTEIEEVFPLISGDSAASSTHVLIGDGRRGDPNAANGQFVRMRALAEQWIERGGSFIVASSAAPFRPVKNDPAGCGNAGDADQQTCPLYAFAFVAPGDQGRVAAALASVFQNLYVTPLPAIPGSGVAMTSRGSAEINLEPGWDSAADGTPIVRARGKKATNTPLAASLVLDDTTSPRGRAMLASLRGRRLMPVFAVRTLAADPAASPWRPSPARGGLMRPTEDPFTYEFISRGSDAPRYLYRLQLHPAGEPSWLEAFDADSAGDDLRTYGLSRLFESFRAFDPGAAPPVLRAYVVVN